MSFLPLDGSMRLQSAETYPAPAQGRNRRWALENLSTGETNGQRTLFEDPSNIQSWAASTARRSVHEPGYHASLSVNRDSMFPSPSSIYPSGEMEVGGQMDCTFPDVMGGSESPLFTAGDALAQTTMAGSFPNTAYGRSEAPFMEFSASSGAATGSSLDFSGSDGSMSPHFYMLDSSSEGDVPPHLDMYNVCPGPWSPSTASADLSLPSACANGAILSSGFLGSPTDFSVAEDFASRTSGEEAWVSQFTLDQSALSNGSYDYLNLDSPDPRQGTAYLSGDQIALEFQGMPYALPPGGVRAKAFFSNRLSSDGENIKARQHELYSVGPGSDGLYHCPFANDHDGCRRKADKLKCNYDKHLDSHLKPYRCQDPACAEVPFSSTACLLRHEREAHGLHGHGDRPYSCHFDGCERAAHGNGFPRRWNLQDHMRRVHNYTLPDLESSGSSENGRPRKRKGSGEATSSKRSGRPSLTRSRG